MAEVDTDTPGRHLLAAFDHDRAVVVCQLAVDAKTNEIPVLRTLLAKVNLNDAVITADALHTQWETASWLVSQGAHYFLVVKSNQPQLHAQVAGLPWGPGPHRRDHPRPRHDRDETRVVGPPSSAPASPSCTRPRQSRCITMSSSFLAQSSDRLHKSTPTSAELQGLSTRNQINGILPSP
ncbi:ISAs1 family transposase [Protofrankia symbiont of Coriaria ruscifolia]|uniref:Transposase IS4-like domain-containing protein n=1 Tax=Candidatus Protofrankia californiensis TaxID=1839754 RepID=A0A1C3P071_9ACTN|nr:ISAs1 family transposase [Protofrankia symbiont of Coriaria ruscifolia]SBW23148.1 hypothetical protein FDG2_3645 [Candidatus Protofrankia californiensis]